MTEVRFYHLQTQPLERALPAILGKVLSTDRRAVVRFNDDKQVKYYNETLWTYDPNGFLPHGSKSDGHAEKQLVYLTATAENPNNAEVLVLCHQQTVPENIADFSLCCDFLDGLDGEAVDHARARWKLYKEAGHNVTYWQQTDSGGWEQKA